jgi:hypothetical protein
MFTYEVTNLVCNFVEIVYDDSITGSGVVEGSVPCTIEDSGTTAIL